MIKFITFLLLSFAIIFIGVATIDSVTGLVNTPMGAVLVSLGFMTIFMGLVMFYQNVIIYETGYSRIPWEELNTLEGKVLKIISFKGDTKSGYVLELVEAGGDNYKLDADELKELPKETTHVRVYNEGGEAKLKFLKLVEIS